MNDLNKDKSLDFENALLNFDRVHAEQILEGALSENNAFEVIDEIVSPALTRIGTAWDTGEIALSQNYMAGRIAEQLMDEILPAESPERIDYPKIAITTLGDYHMLGKKVVTSMLRSTGHSIKEYGNMDLDKLVEKLDEDGIDLLLTSTLMLNIALKINELKKRMDKKELKTKVIAGGAPFLFDDMLYREVGADHMARTSSDVYKLIDQYKEEVHQ
ncbi:cobalamin B12-binding domain-containing protein [Methanohalophilus sp.]